MADQGGGLEFLGATGEGASREQAGNGIGLLEQRRQTVANRRPRERIAHSKTVRRVMAYLKGKDENHPSIGEIEIDALGIVDMWCVKEGREGGPKSQIVDWSGYRRAWKARVYEGLRDCERLGWLETVKVIGGERICITDKGHRILNLYTNLFEAEQEKIDQETIINRLEQETKRLKRETKRLKVA